MIKEINFQQTALSSDEMENLNPQINEIANKLLSSKDVPTPMSIRFLADKVIIVDGENKDHHFKLTLTNNIYEKLVGRTFSLKTCPKGLEAYYQKGLASVKSTQTSNQSLFERYTEEFKKITDELEKMIKCSHAYPLLIHQPAKGKDCDPRICEFNYNLRLLENIICTIQNELDLYPTTGNIKHIELLLPEAKKRLEYLRPQLKHSNIEEFNRPRVNLRSNMDYIHEHMSLAFEMYQLTPLQKKLEELNKRLTERKPYNERDHLEPLKARIKETAFMLNWCQEELKHSKGSVDAPSDTPQLTGERLVSFILDLNRIENALKSVLLT
jgi:hypothetical protein